MAQGENTCFNTGLLLLLFLIVLVQPQSFAGGPTATASPHRVPPLTKSMPSSPVIYNCK